MPQVEPLLAANQGRGGLQGLRSEVDEVLVPGTQLVITLDGPKPSHPKTHVTSRSAEGASAARGMNEP